MKISNLTITAIKNLSPETLASRGVISKARSSGYICPNCGNGEGKSGTGIKPEMLGDVWTYHCFKCDASFDNISLFARHYNLDNDRDFNQICQRACDEFGINADFEPNPSATKKESSRAKSSDPAELERKVKEEAEKARQDAEESKLIRADIKEARANLRDLPKNARRGLTIETLQHFHCGYLTSWTSPKIRAAEGKAPASRRLIIPSSDSHYLASAIDRDALDKQHYKMHAGSKELFNSAAIDNEGVVVIVEGEVDAMSIWQATSGAVHVIAIGGAAADKWIDCLPEKAQFLILFDNDSAGRLNARKLRDKLIQRGYPAAVAFLSDGDTKIDANNILCADDGGASVLANRVNALISGAQADLEKAVTEIADRKALEEKIAEWTADNGDINPAVIERLKSAKSEILNLTPETITTEFAMSSKIRRAAGYGLYYDFYSSIADDLLALIQSAQKINRLPNVSIRDMKSDLDKFKREAAKLHKNFQREQVAQKERQKVVERRIQRQKNLERETMRLEELKAMEPNPTRDDEMRAVIADMCDWHVDRYGDKTAVKSTAANYKRIFDNDPVIDGLFGYDEFQQSDVFLRPAPWKKKFIPNEPWQDSDDSALRVYLRETYTELANEKLCADYLSVYSRRRSFHVIRDWLESLPAWDGVERAKTLFIDYLRADDSEFTREVTMNWLTGALARIFYPGCEYQTALVLNGAQGIGKSGITKMLGNKWHVALKDSVEDSHAIDVIQNGWIVEIEEFWAGSKAEVSALKAFISASADDRRAAYARRAQKALRHCAFVITCNDEQFLKDVTGNRRFLIIHCNAERLDNSAIKKLTPEIIGQVWAEVLVKFRQQFPTDEDFDANKLELPQDMRVQAEHIAQGYMYDDGLAAEIGSFLDRKIPHANIWEELTKEQRRKFVVDNYIELDEVETEEILKDEPQVIRDEILNTASPVEISTGKDRSVTRYRFRGVRYRDETCAAEIFNECFGNDNRKKIRRINEILPTLMGWQLRVKPDGREVRQKNFAACYGDQKRIYYRIDNSIKDTVTEDTDDGYEDPGLPF